MKVLIIVILILANKSIDKGFIIEPPRNIDNGFIINAPNNIDDGMIIDFEKEIFKEEPIVL